MASRISIQGEPGSYSHQACAALEPQAALVPRTTFEGALDAVAAGEADRALVPVENSTYGRVADIHRLLPDSGLRIIGEHFLRIHIALLALPGTALSDVRTAASHPVLLGQCRRFLHEHGIEGRLAADTAGAARAVATQQDHSRAALAPALAAEIHGLQVLASEIEDAEHNTTRFLLLAPGSPLAAASGEPCMTSIVFEVRNLPAALYKALGGFATNGVNLVKLESYMIGGSFTATLFWADIEGHVDDPPVRRALEELRYFTSRLQIMGVYAPHPYRRRVGPRPD